MFAHDFHFDLIRGFITLGSVDGGMYTFEHGNGIRVSLLFAHIERDKAGEDHVVVNTYGQEGKKMCSHRMYKTSSVTFNGEDYMCPDESYLEDLYGITWLTGSYRQPVEGLDFFMQVNSVTDAMVNVHGGIFLPWRYQEQLVCEVVPLPAALVPDAKDDAMMANLDDFGTLVPNSHKQQMFAAALHSAKKALDGLGVPFFLCFGTALGARRENRFIPHDPDIDLSIFRKDFDASKSLQLPAAMQQHGFIPRSVGHGCVGRCLCMYVYALHDSYTLLPF